MGFVAHLVHDPSGAMNNHSSSWSPTWCMNVYEHSGVSVVPGCRYVHAPRGEFELPIVQFLLRILGKGLDG